MTRLAENRSRRQTDFARSDELRAIEKRISTLRNWLKDRGEGCTEKQAHLDDGPERIYWHYGYAVALQDVLDLLERRRQSLN